MGDTEQLYCTHCTYGTSAIERREGEMADRVLGYNARASSLKPDQLRQFYRAVERFMYYYLPNDAPPEQKTTLTGHTAATRLVFHPSASGFQLVAQVSYRQFDRANRPGSYFAHVLAAPRRRTDEPWSVVECLQLFGASGWKVEETEDMEFSLPALKSPTDLLDGHPAYVTDETLHSFLTTTPWAEFASPLIPPRWQKMDVKQRQGYFRAAVHGYLGIAEQRREQLLLIIEPEMAVVFFYGILRVLPEIVQKEVSFSTYETNPDRLFTTLAAMQFFDDASDIKPERYQRGYVLNTHIPVPADDQVAVAGAYVKFIDTIIQDTDNRWTEIAAMLEVFDEAKGRRVADLDELADAANLVRQIFDPPPATAEDASPKLDSSWEKSKIKRNSVAKAVRKRLSGEADLPLLERILASPERLAIVLKLTTDQPEPGPCQPSVEYLVQHLPQQEFSRFLASGEVAKCHKTDALISYAKAHKRLPPGSDDVWKDALREWNDKRPEAASLTHVLKGLDTDELKQFAASVPPSGKEGFFFSLLTVAGADKEKRHILVSLTERLTEHQVLEILTALGTRMDIGKELQQAFGERLRDILDNLHETPTEITGKLAVLRKDQNENLLRLASDSDVLSMKRLDAWLEIETKLLDALARSTRPSFWKQASNDGGRQSDDFGKRLAQQVLIAFPTQSYPDVTAEQKAKCVEWMAASLSATSTLPKQFSGKLTCFLEQHRWPSSPQVKRTTRVTKVSALPSAHVTTEKSARTLPFSTLNVATVLAITIGIFSVGSLIAFVVMSDPATDEKAVTADTTGAPTASEELPAELPPSASPVRPDAEITAGDGEAESAEIEELPAEPPPPASPVRADAEITASDGEAESAETEEPPAEHNEVALVEPGDPPPDDTVADIPVAHSPLNHLPRPHDDRNPKEAALFESDKSGWSIHIHGLDVLKIAHVKRQDVFADDPNPLETWEIEPSSQDDGTVLLVHAKPKKTQQNRYLLADFLVDGQVVKCRMPHPPDKLEISEHFREFQKRLSYCVLELRMEDEPSQFVALQQPLKRGPFEIKKEQTVTLAPSSLVKDVYLMGGRLISNEIGDSSADSSQIRFGYVGDEPRTSWKLPELVERYGIDSAVFSVKRTPPGLHFLLETQPSRKSLRAARDSELNAIVRQRREFEQYRDEVRAPRNPKSFSDAARWLAGHFDIPPANGPPNLDDPKDREKKRTAYRNYLEGYVREKVLPPTTAKIEALQEEIDQINSKYDELDKQAVRPWQEINLMRVHVYRIVDADGTPVAVTVISEE